MRISCRLIGWANRLSPRPHGWCVVSCAYSRASVCVHVFVAHWTLQLYPPLNKRLKLNHGITHRTHTQCLPETERASDQLDKDHYWATTELAPVTDQHQYSQRDTLSYTHLRCSTAVVEERISWLGCNGSESWGTDRKGTRREAAMPSFYCCRPSTPADPHFHTPGTWWLYSTENYYNTANGYPDLRKE